MFRSTGVLLLVAASSAAPAMAAAGFVRVGGIGIERATFAVTLPDGRVLVAAEQAAQLYDPAGASFSPAGTMTVPRGGAPGVTATLLADGRVLIAGGTAFDGSSLSSAEIYDPAAGTFTPTGSMAGARTGHTATRLADGRVLVVAGRSFNHSSGGRSGVEIYDPASGSFATLPGIAAARSGHTAALLADGRVLIAGGYGTFGQALAAAELYDAPSGSAAAAGNMNTARGDHTSTTLPDGTTLLAGGHSGAPGGSLAAAEVYDPAAGVFTPVGAMAAQRGSHTAARLADGTVLVAGGFTAYPFAPALASAEIYDPGTGAFAGTATMHQARGRHVAAALANGDVFVAGGVDGCCNPEGTAEVFSLAVVDRHPPVVIVPSDVTVLASSPEGAVVTFTVSATDDVDVNLAVTCTPASGSVFPIGTTVVVCTATDDAGHVGSAEFNVTVLEGLRLGMTIEPVGQVHPTTGLAILRGTVTCNRAINSGIQVSLSQALASGPASGSGGRAFNCVPPSSVWITFVSSESPFAPGQAEASASIFACDMFGCDAAAVAAAVELRPWSPDPDAVVLTRVAQTRTVTPEGVGPFSVLGAPFVQDGTALFPGYGIGLSEGLYAGTGGPLTVVADATTAVPGGTGTFGRVDSPSFDGRQVAFQGVDAAREAALFLRRGPDLARIADSGTPVPDSSETFRAFIGPVLMRDRILFRGGSEPSPFFAFGIYTADAASVGVVADRQTAVPGGTGLFGSFGDTVTDGDTVVFLGGSFTGDRGIYRSRAGALTTVADLSTPVPGGSGTFLFFDTPAIGSGLVAFTALDASFRTGVYQSDGGVLTRVADTNTPVPGQDALFDAFGRPVVDGEAVVFGALKQPFGSAGIYAARGGVLTPLADVNTPAPGDQGHFREFGPPMAAKGNVAFQAVDATGTAGIYARVGGTLRKVVSWTEPIDGKQVSFFELATGGGCDFSGCGRGFGTGFDGRHIAFLATFADGSQGIYLADLASGTPFATLDARVRADGGTVHLASSFTLGAGSDGIAPLDEDVTLGIGSRQVTIPAGSFRVVGKAYRFAGRIGGIWLEAVIRSRGESDYALRASARVVHLDPAENPVDVTVAIGDDFGGTTVMVEFAEDDCDDDRHDCDDDE